MAEAWIECVDCGQWRRVVDLDEKYNAEGAKWCVAAYTAGPGSLSLRRARPLRHRHCRDNTDEAHRSCSAPQELSDNEIDERLRAQVRTARPPCSKAKRDAVARPAEQG